MRMGIGLGVAAVGAIIRYAIDTSDVESIDLPIVGLILMIVGGLAFLVDVIKEFSMRPARPQAPAAPVATSLPPGAPAQPTHVPQQPVGHAGPPAAPPHQS